MEIYDNKSIIQFDIGLSEWLGNQRFQMTIPLKNVCIHILSMCDCLERFGNADSLLGTIEDTGNDSYLVTFTKKELTLLYNSYPEISEGTVKTGKRNNKRSNAQYDKLFETLDNIANLKVKRVYSPTHKESMIMGRTAKEENGKYTLEINKSFTREVLMFDKSGLHGNLYKCIAGILTPLELTVFTFILYNHTSIESQIMNGSPYLGYSYESLSQMWGISSRPEDGNISIRRAIEGINSALNTHLNFEYDGSRIRFFCEEGNTMGKYFTSKHTRVEDTNKDKNSEVKSPKPKTDYKIYTEEYERIFGIKPILTRDSFKTMTNSIQELIGEYSIDKLVEIMTKYKDLGYDNSNTIKFGAHLFTNPKCFWVIQNILNDIRYKNTSNLTGKVGTVPMEHQDWMDQGKEYTDEDWEREY